MSTSQLSNSLLLLIFSTFFTFSQSLTLDFYSKTCPKFLTTMQSIIINKQLEQPTTAAATLRLFFHDCMVGGCDGSTLITTRPTSNTSKKAERDADINVSLAGDAFDLIAKVKTALELDCPRVVSCSDILAVATRQLVVMTGGPHYPVALGRRDSLTSESSLVDGHLARPTFPISKIITMFNEKGFNVQEMVALLGAHTIGFSHCAEFADRLFNFSDTVKTDPSLNPGYAERLKKLCENYVKQPEMTAFNDVRTPGKFDNMYYRNLKDGLGLLLSDQVMAADERTKGFVDEYAADETKFFQDFGRAMEKVSLYQVKEGNEGEIRRTCNQFNNVD